MKYYVKREGCRDFPAPVVGPSVVFYVALQAVALRSALCQQMLSSKHLPLFHTTADARMWVSAVAYKGPVGLVQEVAASRRSPQ